jgi:hypothetical protein
MCQRLRKLERAHKEMHCVQRQSSQNKNGCLSSARTSRCTCKEPLTCRSRSAQGVVEEPLTRRMNREMCGDRTEGMLACDVGSVVGRSIERTYNRPSCIQLSSISAQNPDSRPTSHSILGDSCSSHWDSKPSRSLVRSGSSSQGSLSKPSSDSADNEERSVVARLTS